MNIIEWMNSYILGGEKIGVTVFPVIMRSAVHLLDKDRPVFGHSTMEY